MMGSRYSSFAGVVVLILLVSSSMAGEPNHAVIAVPRDGEIATQRFHALNELVKQQNDAKLLFLGDSITQGWEGAGRQAWEKYYGRRNALNLGISGDLTQHVLWRLDHGNIDGLSPKLVVVMIGTNNSDGNEYTAEQIGEGIAAVVKKLRRKLPKAKILILAIFPRDTKPSPQREKNARASRIAAKLADNKMIYFLDMGQAFLQADGTLSEDVMPDFVHLSSKGYEIWAKEAEPTVAQLLDENEKQQ